MLEYEEALARITAVVPPPACELIALRDASGRVTTERVASPVDLPNFDHSSMDGYAVRAQDTASAAPGSPTRLRLIGRIAAGAVFAGEVEAGTCVRLFTGSPLPLRADAVLMQEDTQVDPNHPEEIRCLATAKPGENIRRKGETVKQGAPLVEAGAPLTPFQLALLAAAGIGEVGVGCQPTVGILASGSELREPGEPLGPGQIYESNRGALAALMRRVGAKPTVMPIVVDALAATRLALARALEQFDVVVTSGGVSVGELDFIKRAFEEGGGQLEFWQVAIRPGKPFAFGRWGNKLFFGLPGNPVSALVTYLLLVRPALLRWQGAVEIALPSQWAVMAEALNNPGERRHFVRVQIDKAGKVRSAGLQASHALSSMANANGLVDLSPHATLEAGTMVQALRWE
jgi:molybdopterin molybdotransferase